MMNYNNTNYQEYFSTDFKSFLKEAKQIYDKEWIKGIHPTNPGSAGLTYEALLGKEVENFAIPDYLGIELKTRRRDSTNLFLELFTANPDNTFFEAKRLVETYGYEDREKREYKVFNVRASTGFERKINENCFLKLEVSRKEEKIYVVIYDKEGNLIERKVSWTFALLKEKVEMKLSSLALIEYEKKWIYNEPHYWYKMPRCYKLRSFEKFIDLIECGAISVAFRVGVYKRGRRMGETYDHGTTFNIFYNRIDELFEEFHVSD